MAWVVRLVRLLGSNANAAACLFARVERYREAQPPTASKAIARRKRLAVIVLAAGGCSASAAAAAVFVRAMGCRRVQPVLASCA